MNGGRILSSAFVGRERERQIKDGYFSTQQHPKKQMEAEKKCERTKKNKERNTQMRVARRQDFRQIGIDGECVAPT